MEELTEHPIFGGSQIGMGGRKISLADQCYDTLSKQLNIAYTVERDVDQGQTPEECHTTGEHVRTHGYF